MNIKDIIFIAILSCILIWVFYIKYENFFVSAYNTDIEIEPLKTDIIIQNEKIKNALSNKFNEEYNIEKVNKTSFNQLSYYETFAMDTFFKENCLDKLKNILSPDFPNINLLSVPDLQNIFWKDIDNSRHFIFDIVTTSSNYQFIRVFTCYCILNNLNKYILDDGSYVFDIKSTFSNSDVNIVYIIDIINSNKENTLSGNNLFNYYEIKNKLHLMDPFITSGKEIQITQTQKEEFEKLLTKKSEILTMYSNGNCFDTSNNIVFSGENTDENIQECSNKDSLNKWDTYPLNEFECPFYNKNLNYPNSFGKLNNNICEMPLNVKIQGYRYYSLDPKFAPLCYNCKTDLTGNGSLGTCCDKQLDKREYPNLITPDYAYKNDKFLRQKYKDLFVQKNLEII